MIGVTDLWLFVVAGFLLNVTPASAARDRTPPTTPTALRVTATTPTSISLSWNASFDKGTFNSGIGILGPRRNPVGSAFYYWDGTKSNGIGYLPENWHAYAGIFAGALLVAVVYFGIDPSLTVGAAARAADALLAGIR